MGAFSLYLNKDWPFNSLSSIKKEEKKFPSEFECL